MAFLRRRCWFFLILLLFFCGPQPLANAADNLTLQEQEVKAGLLYNFLKYTQWPAPSPSMAVCVYGDDPFEGYLQPIAGRTVNQREISLRMIHAVDETAACQLLFLNSSEQQHWPELQKFLAGKSVLTVSDFDSFAESGGMIEFGRKNDHISVKLNMDALLAAHLQVGERLLRLVTVVHPSSLKEGQ